MEAWWIGISMGAIFTAIVGGWGVWAKLKLEKKEEEERLRKQSLDENGSRPRSVPG